MTLNTFDIVMGAIFLLLVIRGFFRGFVTEIMSMAAILAGTAAAVFLSGPFAQILKNNTSLQWGTQIIAFAGVFVAAFVIVKIVELILHKVFETLNLRQLDRLLGFVLGAAEGFLLVCFVVFMLNRQPFFTVTDLQNGSFVYRTIASILPYGLSLIRERMPHV